MALPLLCLFGCRPAPVLPSLIYSDPLDIGGAYLNDGLHRTSITGKNVVEGNKQSSGQSLGVAIPTWHVLDDFSVKVAIGSFEDDPIIVEGIGEINADNCRDYRFFIEGLAHISALNNSRPGPWWAGGNRSSASFRWLRVLLELGIHGRWRPSEDFRDRILVANRL